MDYGNDFEDGFEYTSLGALHYMHHPGMKDTIIFLHGLGANTKAWSRLVQHLPADLDVFLLDLLGHGGSDAPMINYTLTNQFLALREFIEHQNINDSYIFGHSYGGWVAAYYAAQRYVTKGIILEDTAGLKQQLDDIIKSGTVADYKQNLLKSVLMVNDNKEYVFNSIINSSFSAEQLTPEVLSRISVKTKIIWGTDDRVVDKEYSQILLKNIKRSSINMIEGAGHEPHFTNPEEVSGILIEFMNQ